MDLWQNKIFVQQQRGLQRYGRELNIIYINIIYITIANVRGRTVADDVSVSPSEDNSVLYAARVEA